MLKKKARHPINLTSLLTFLGFEKQLLFRLGWSRRVRWESTLIPLVLRASLWEGHLNYHADNSVILQSYACLSALQSQKPPEHLDDNPAWYIPKDGKRNRYVLFKGQTQYAPFHVTGQSAGILFTRIRTGEGSPGESLTVMSSLLSCLNA